MGSSGYHAEYMGDNIYPLTRSGMMSPVLFLLPILLCVAQAEPSGKFLLIDTVDDEESGRRADDYQINIGGFPSWWSSFADRFPSLVRPVVVQPQPQARDPCVQSNAMVAMFSTIRQGGKTAKIIRMIIRYHQKTRSRAAATIIKILLAILMVVDTFRC